MQNRSLPLGLALLSGALLVAAAEPLARAGVRDPGFTETTVVPPGPLAGATGFAWAADGSDRLLVTLQPGAIRMVKDGVLLPEPFATVAPVYTSVECGLTGIAFDPAFLVTRQVYLFACVSSSEQQVIRYNVDGDVGSNKTTVVPGLPTLGTNHNGGGLGVGPDGKLYWAIGDNGNYTGANADLSSNAAKVGRANRDGTPVADNPFFDGPGPNADFIWARGFRNPFTLSFQPATGLLWVNDVGSAYEQVYIVRRGDHAGFSMYFNNQPAGFITPTVKYRTGTYDVRQLAAAPAGAVRAGGGVTFTTADAHGFRRGDKIVVATAADATFNGTVYVTGVPTPTSFTALQPGPNASSGGGTATSASIGACVAGGAFYDSTAFPPNHRGNLFFAEYMAHRIVRAVLDPRSNEVNGVDIWADEVGDVVDVAVGPDGALYYLTHTGRLGRLSYNAFDQALIVTPTNIWIGDGEAAAVMVRLASKPPAGVSLAVSVSRTAGDTDVAIQSGGTLTFTEDNWNKPQRVTVSAGHDLDDRDDSGIITVTAPGLATEQVTVHARDQAGPELVVSPVALELTEEGSGSFSVSLSRQPFLDLAITAERSVGDPEIAISGGAALTFTSANWSMPQMVNVTAGRHAGVADRSATITVGGAGLAPRTVIVTARNSYAAGLDAGADASTDAPVTGDVGDSARGDGRDSGSAGSESGDGCGCRLSGGRGGDSGPQLLLLAAAVLAIRLRRSRIR